jgi:hypothetical protein
MPPVRLTRIGGFAVGGAMGGAACECRGNGFVFFELPSSGLTG